MGLEAGSLLPELSCSSVGRGGGKPQPQGGSMEAGDNVCVGPGSGPGHPPPLSHPTHPFLLLRGGQGRPHTGLPLTAVQEGGLFVQSSLTVSKSLPGALVPNSNVAGLIPATPPRPAGRSLPQSAPARLVTQPSLPPSPPPAAPTSLPLLPGSCPTCWICPFGTGRSGRHPALQPSNPGELQGAIVLRSKGIHAVLPCRCSGGSRQP